MEIECFSYIYCLAKKSCNDYNNVFHKHNDIFYSRVCLQLCLLVINSSIHYQGNHNKYKKIFFVCPFIGMLGFLHQNLSWQNVLIVKWLLFTNSFISCVKNRLEPWNTLKKAMSSYLWDIVVFTYSIWKKRVSTM